MMNIPLFSSHLHLINHSQIEKLLDPFAQVLQGDVDVKTTVFEASKGKRKENKQRELMKNEIGARDDEPSVSGIVMQIGRNWKWNPACKQC